MRRLRQRARACQRFVRDRAGNIAILFALLAPCILGGVGIALDLGLALQTRISLLGALDAATLAAAKAGVDYIKSNPGSTLSDIPAASTAGTNFFNANIASATGPRAASVSAPIFTITASGGLVTAKAKVTAVLPTSFFKALGKNSVTISVASSTSARAPLYINFTMLLDVSQSMGIGASQADMQKLFDLLQTRYGVGCVFACHSVSGDYPVDTYLFAGANGVTLRTDAMRSAVSTLITDAQNSSASGYFTFALYTMGINLTRITSPTNNYTYLQAAAATIGQELSNSSGPADSYLSEGLSSVSASIPSNGTGASSSSPLQYALIVTDGMQDANYGWWCTWGHCTWAMDTSVCQTLKNKGVTVIVVYTTYLPIYNQPSNPGSGYDYRYSALVQNAVPNVAPALQSCASGATNYFEASDTTAINIAFKSIFTNLQNVLLTN